MSVENPTTTADLIARLEKLDAPCREVDKKIAFAARFRPSKGILRKSFDEFEAKHDYGTAWIAHRPWHEEWNIPRYTASVDAALTLVPTGLQWSLEADGAWVRWLTTEDVGEAQCVLFGRGGKATALALCVAALKARAELPQSIA